LSLIVSELFTPITLRGLTARNRVWVAPMCQYSATDGLPDDWHLAHLGSFARAGVGVVLTEATAVVPEGRISPQDTGLWNDEQTAAWRRITDFAHRQGAAIGVQLAHAGRKASTRAPWERGVATAEEGGWEPVAPSPTAYPGLLQPRELTLEEIAAVPAAFGDAAERALAAGFDLIEVHAAHGYLLHQFLSPLSNQRNDAYGGSFENRTRLVHEVVDAIRARVPEDHPVILRISATDWLEGGWDADASVELARALADRVDLVDVSTGGVAPARIEVGPGYQVPFAERIRAEAGIPTGAVGLITEPSHAEEIVKNGQADVVLLARALLREPHWALRAATELGGEVDWPRQYERARPA
jgi:2,4-dienoyl-CoA reductase-like NADH-dependent reductase (Old Yellow Enzyme family)